MDITQRVGEARDAAKAWAAAKPRTAKRNQAAAAAIAAYVEVDALLAAGMSLPDQWATCALPSVDEVAEALQAVGLMVPIDQAPVKVIAAKVVEVMTSRRAPRKPTHPDWQLWRRSSWLAGCMTVSGAGWLTRRRRCSSRCRSGSLLARCLM